MNQKDYVRNSNAVNKKQITEAFSKIKAKGNNLWSIMGNLVVSCVSSYLEYQNAGVELLEGFDNEMWRLKKEEIEECNRLQVMLLNASWNLLRQYKLPDEYRLTQDSLNSYYKAVNESDPSKRLRMLRARNVERNFQMYPPYWFYRAVAAIELKDDDEAAKCYDKFAEVWRPVLRNDPYKLEEAKYRVQKLALNTEKNRDEIRKWLEVIQDCISAGDWSNNLFVGIAYFLLGDKDEGIRCLEVNIDFDYEYKISGMILAQMKKGKLNISVLKKGIQTLDKNIMEIKQAASPAKTKAASGGCNSAVFNFFFFLLVFHRTLRIRRNK